MRFERKHLYRSAAVIGVLGLAALPFAASSSAASRGQEDADKLRQVAGAPGAVVVVKDGDTTQTYASGSVRQGQQEAPTADHKFRVASNAKTYIGTVVLQLVDEGKVDLDTAIGKYLPGLVKGEGIDENKITVRHLLQHQSGLPDYLADAMNNPAYQNDPPTPVELVELGLRGGSQFEPGTKSQYCNTGYVILGLLIEKITGQGAAEAIDQRIVEPLGLQKTNLPAPGEKKMEGAHFSGYVNRLIFLEDVTEFEPGVWSYAGATVSTGSDMNAFVEALLAGKLLSPAMLEEMKTVVDESVMEGLGLQRSDLTCGQAWGHWGGLFGYTSVTMAKPGGKSVFVAVNATPANISSETVGKEMSRIIEAELCGSDSAGANLPGGAKAELTQLDKLARATAPRSNR